MFKFLHSQHFQTVINAFCNTHSANDSYDLDGAKWKIHILHFFFFSDKEKCVCRGCFILKKLQVAESPRGARPLQKRGCPSMPWQQAGWGQSCLPCLHQGRSDPGRGQQALVSPILSCRLHLGVFLPAGQPQQPLREPRNLLFAGKVGVSPLSPTSLQPLDCGKKSPCTSKCSREMLQCRGPGPILV